MGHDIAAIGIPSFLVLVGILLNQDGLRNLKEDMHREFGRIYARLDHMQSDLDKFHRSLGQHEILEKKG